MSEHILAHKHQAQKHQTHNHVAHGWRIHCGVEVTELSTNKQHTLSIEHEDFLFVFVGSVQGIFFFPLSFRFLRLHTWRACYSQPPFATRTRVLKSASFK
jgi:hypothetical protein